MQVTLSQGNEFHYTRKITRTDIIEFSRISGDQGIHHREGEKLLAHGLLVATLPTKLGGDINYIASDMHFKFLMPVYEEETITCTARIEKIIEQKSRLKGWFSFECRNEQNEIVLKGSSFGMIWKN